MMRIDLCAVAELAEPGSHGFPLPPEAAHLEVESLFVVRREDAVYGYLNRCPHIGSPLEWQPHEFLDPEGAFIQCAMHGALFRMEDGFCVSGPCAGDSLAPVALEVIDGRVIALLPDQPS
jgi:nitrite reductase/ring-hydroxylating ferredoxin subunit